MKNRGGRGGLGGATALAGVVGLVLGAGCSTFDRDFEVALLHGPYTDFTGPWEGRWKSDVSGHDGKLRCLLSETGVNAYHARFRANWGGIFVFNQDLPLKASLEAGGASFTGSVHLPFHGAYDWTGRIVGDTFTAEYRTDKDKGTFSLSRPGQAAPAAGIGATSSGASP